MALGVFLLVKIASINKIGEFCNGCRIFSEEGGKVIVS